MRARRPKSPILSLLALSLLGAAACGVATPIIDGGSNAGDTNAVSDGGGTPTTTPGTSNSGGTTPTGPSSSTNGNGLIVGSVVNGQIVLTPQQQDVSYWVDEMLNRSNITSDPTTGTVQQGAPLTLNLRIYNVTQGSSAPLMGAMVDVWQANASGVYSDSSSQHTSGKQWLRGYQVTDAQGDVSFVTIVPGWTSGHAPHINLRIREGSASYNWTTLLFFDENVTSSLFAQAPYSNHTGQDTTNDTDSDYQAACVEGSQSYPCGLLTQLVLTTDGNGNSVATMNIYIDTTGT